MQNIAIFASHNGSGFEAIHNAILEKKLDLNIALLLSNNPNSSALDKAKRLSIPTTLVNNKLFQNPDDEIYRILKEQKCQYIFLSGYMKKIAPLIINNFTIINSHPSLLPKYGGAGMYGRNVHNAVISNNEAVSGVTIHEVDAEYDSGKIIFQDSLNIAIDETPETLENKIKSLEKVSIVKALVKFFDIS